MNTAGATVRQLVSLVFERVLTEDGQETAKVRVLTEDGQETAKVRVLTEDGQETAKVSPHRGSSASRRRQW